MDKSGGMIGRETRHHDRGWRNRTRQLTIAPQERNISYGDSLIRARASEHFESRTYGRRPKGISRVKTGSGVAAPPACP